MTVDDDFLPGEPPAHRLSRDELRADLPAGLRYAAILVVVGLPLGALWAFLAPVVHTVALPGGGSGVPAGEADHAFDAVAIHVLLIAAFGVIAGAVAWRRRHRRGPVLLVALVVGSLAGAWVAGRIGGLLAWAASPIPVLVDPAALDRAGAPGGPVPAVLTSVPPSPGPWWLALVAGLAAALTYVLAAIIDGHEEMGRDPAAS
ncbi:DUF2567 domain-containing protein [Actinomycetospora cinnamomea]|uniref:Uncharacterized protein DUF2567 n=1 Tax=Actinomycetospora cinnamomea TaxID=663609 RepID=A0A2U1F9M0_9PSEU|nr:DUF2567 domain-containing protein [Actinomycetospora cinnamomea]PVZ08885.1 uncharacterized protein DUF2567 [Actinomycetospora cinnamomea]